MDALGIDFALGPNDVAIRGNFCTIDDAGRITDLRAIELAGMMTLAGMERHLQASLDTVKTKRRNWL